MPQCYMRTALNLDDDIAEVARTLASLEGRPLGHVISRLVRRGLAPRESAFDDGNDVPVFRVSPEAAVITPRMVETALDGE